jgi:hypothetical protein
MQTAPLIKPSCWEVINRSGVAARPSDDVMPSNVRKMPRPALTPAVRVLLDQRHPQSTHLCRACRN